jgi:hypothetical protein
MATLQTPMHETLQDDRDSEDVELTSFVSRTDNNSHVDPSKSHGSRMSSVEALNRPHHSRNAAQSPVQLYDTTGNSHSYPIGSSHRSAVQRMGTHTVVILTATLVLKITVFSFLAFLWTASHDNNFWRVIVVRGWASSAVTVSSLLLRTAVDFQSGVAVAMLAAIILETDVCLLMPDAAQVSKLRAGRSMPLDLVLTVMRAMMSENGRYMLGCVRVSVVVLLLVATTILLQFTSTMLVSDLSLGVLSGMPVRAAFNFDFVYKPDDTRGLWSYPLQPRAASTWSMNPSAFPSFAEFSEAIDVPEHVDDTGRLLRALLPFQDAQSRETLVSYSGKALVLDARVSCQRPQLQGLNFGGAYMLTGKSSGYTSHFDARRTD